MPPSASALLHELEKNETTAQRRLQISETLAKLGDPRPGVGLVDGLPDIAWLPVTPGGTVKIMRIWHPETPEEEARVLDTQYFDVAPFYIAKYPVTYAQYQAFVEAEDGFDNLAWWQAMPAAVQRQPLAEQRSQLPNTPRDSLSWYQCMAFAHWLNQRLQGFELPHPGGESVLRVGDNAQVRLPAEWEWQWAAQNGTEVRTYPWGESAPDRANTAETGLEQAIAVGMYPQGAAACGALDMAGNLMEWCANDKDPMDHIDVASDAPKVLRGGDWGFPLDIATCIYVDDETPERFDPLNGFRLVLG